MNLRNPLSLIKQIKITPARRKLLTAAVKGYFAGFAVANIGGIPTTSILSPVLILLCTFLFYHWDRSALQEQHLPVQGKLFLQFRKASLLLGFIFALAYIAAEHEKLAGLLENKLFRFLYLAMTAFGLFFLFYHCCLFLFLHLKERRNRIYTGQALTKPQIAGLFALLLLCFLPWFLYDYPGVMTPDSLSQYSQAIGATAYSNHHPWVHTMLIRFWLNIGNALFHNTYAVIACYTLFQMAAVALMDTYCICVLNRNGLSRRHCFLLLLFFGLVPYNGIFAVTMWKDVLFSGFLMVFALCLYQLLKQHTAGGSLLERKGTLFLFLLTGVLVCLMRSNGMYVFVLSAPFILFAFFHAGHGQASSRREEPLKERHFARTLKPRSASKSDQPKKPASPRRVPCRSFFVMAAVLTLILAASLTVWLPVMQAFEVASPAFTEALSLPAQQIARVICEGRTLSQNDKALLNQTVDVSLIPDYYNPSISDPIKALIQYGHPEYLESHKADYLKLWLRLGLTYPGDYLHAFMDETRGYWFPETAGMITNEGISPNDLDLSAQPVIRGQAAAKAVEIVSKLYTIFPVLGLLWSPGAFTWLLLFLFTYTCVAGGRPNRTVFLPYFAVLVTLFIATPVASDLRYAYPLVLSAPFLLFVGLESPAATERAS